MTTECHHISSVCLSLSDCRALAFCSRQQEHCISLASQDRTRQIIISVWVDCLLLQLFLPVTLQAQQHATSLIKFQMSFYPPYFPLPSPSPRSWKYTFVLQSLSFSPYQVAGDGAKESKTARRKWKRETQWTKKERGDSTSRGNTSHIKPDIRKVWHKRCFLCYQAPEPQPICAYAASQQPNKSCKSTNHTTHSWMCELHTFCSSPSI